MKRARPTHLHEDVQHYEYPQHLRQAISHLPTGPGVYVFHGDGTLPLYIGKSVNIRSRVLSHLRTPQEARLLKQTRHITHVATAGETGALLLEAQMVKTQQPLMNKKLRSVRQLCAFQLNGQALSVVSTQHVNFAMTPELYGLFRSRRAAMEALHVLADEHRLCLGMLGLERLPPGRACFRSMLKKCAGACSGQETAHAHHERLQQALEHMRVACWPYDGAIAMVEQSKDMTDYLVVRNWCYLGKASNLDDARKLDRVDAGFDADGYKILCGPILKQSVPIVPLGA